MKYGPWVFLIFCLSCTAIADCELDNNTEQFFIQFNHDEISIFLFQSVTNDQTDEIYFDDNDTLTNEQLPLTEITNQLTYTFRTDSFNYQLTLSYDHQLTIYGEDCPSTMRFTNLQVVDYTFFDTAFVSNNILTSRIEENVEVFF